MMLYWLKLLELWLRCFFLRLLSMNKSKTIYLCSLISWLFFSCESISERNLNGDTPVDEVNPYMGNISHLLMPTFPMVHLPNSMMRFTPNRKDYTCETIEGFPLILTSHRGISAFTLSPIIGDVDSLPIAKEMMYDQEQVMPYYYSVRLPEDDIHVAYAPSTQSAIYQFNYETKPKVRGLQISVPKGRLTAKGNTVRGYQDLNDSVRVYLYLESDLSPSTLGLRDEKSGRIVKSNHAVDGQSVLLIYNGGSKPIHLRYGISYISEEQAKQNVEREIQTYEIDMIAKAGRAKWNESLSRIEIEGGSAQARSVFYTSLYRTYERMINISEDKRYYSAERRCVMEDKGVPFYTDDWVWDTYLATHPLRIILEPKKQQHILQSYLRIAEATKEKWLPTFPEVTGDSHRMNGNHAISLFADAYSKGLSGFDLGKAYEYGQKSLEEKSHLPWTRMPREVLTDHMHKEGYFPALKVGEVEPYPFVTKWEKRQSVAVSLAACYDYWTLSILAKQLGRDTEAKDHLRKSYNYHKLYNHKTAFFHPKDKDGRFIEPFDYERSGGLGARDYYDENNAYTYRWDLKHNIADLIYLMGGNDAFIRNLDNTYRTPLSTSKWEFYNQMPDQTGNVGQFSMGNEPSMHIPYLYVYAGAPWRTQRLIHKLVRSWFRNDLMGLPGDEDGGGLSAFVVFSMMGFYPVTPGMPIYVIGSPMFEKIKINLPTDKQFFVKANNFSEENIYIQSAKLNGKDLRNAWFRHVDLISGGELVLEMGNKPNKKWGTAEPPPSADRLELLPVR